MLQFFSPGTRTLRLGTFLHWTWIGSGDRSLSDGKYSNPKSLFAWGYCKKFRIAQVHMKISGHPHLPWARLGSPYLLVLLLTKQHPAPELGTAQCFSPSTAASQHDVPSSCQPPARGTEVDVARAASSLVPVLRQGGVRCLHQALSGEE